eukprot:3605475-Prymnesium_polylepis.1
MSSRSRIASIAAPCSSSLESRGRRRSRSGRGGCCSRSRLRVPRSRLSGGAPPRTSDSRRDGAARFRVASSPDVLATATAPTAPAT